MTDSRVRVFESFAKLPAHFLRLLDADEKRDLFCTRKWFETLATNGLDAKSKLRIYAMDTTDGRALAVIPCCIEEAGKLGPLANYYSSFFEPLIAPEVPEKLVAEAFARHVRHERWAQINLRPLDVNSVSYSAMREAFAKEGYVVQEYFLYGNWYLEVGHRTSAEYLKSLSSVITNNVKRVTKQLLSTGRATIEVCTGGDTLEAAIQAYERVYETSWRDREARQGFISDLIRVCAAQRWLRLGILYLDGVPAAAQLWITRSGTASIYKIAYDEKFAKLSLGTALTAHMMKVAIDEDRVTTVDYLSGDDEYKSRWMSHRRERWGLLAFDLRTASGLAGAIRHVGGHWLKEKFARRKTKDAAAKVLESTNRTR